MFTHDPATIAVTEPSQIGEARRLGVSMAEALNFDQTSRGQIAIVITELASNLVRHATGGEILLRSIPPVNCCGLEILALDRGPGIVSIPDALRDGFSTGTTPGNGLGAVDRLSTQMDIFSSAAHGTAMVAQFRIDSGQSEDLSQIGWVCLPKLGEIACGDACDVIDLGGGRTVVMIADGLGHGLHAAEASRRAVQTFQKHASLSGPELLPILHGVLRATRGAAISIADIRRGQNEIRFTGIGNVTGKLITPAGVRGMVNQNGTVGAEMRRMQEFTYPWSGDTLLVMHSDGLTSQWDLANYPGLFRKHASLIAGVLYRDFRRQRDDVTVLALADRSAA